MVHGCSSHSEETVMGNGKLNDPEYGIFTGPGRVEAEIA